MRSILQLAAHQRIIYRKIYFLITAKFKLIKLDMSKVKNVHVSTERSFIVMLPVGTAILSVRLGKYVVVWCSEARDQFEPKLFLDS